jgi:hypothetical protein
MPHPTERERPQAKRVEGRQEGIDRETDIKKLGLRDYWFEEEP